MALVRAEGRLMLEWKRIALPLSFFASFPPFILLFVQFMDYSLTT